MPVTRRGRRSSMLPSSSATSLMLPHGCWHRGPPKPSACCFRDLHNAFSRDVIDGLHASMHESGFHVLMAFGDGPQLERSVLDTFRSYRMDGAVLIGPEVREREIEAFGDVDADGRGRAAGAVEVGRRDRQRRPQGCGARRRAPVRARPPRHRPPRRWQCAGRRAASARRLRRRHASARASNATFASPVAGSPRPTAPTASTSCCVDADRRRRSSPSTISSLSAPCSVWPSSGCRPPATCRSSATTTARSPPSAGSDSPASTSRGFEIGVLAASLLHERFAGRSAPRVTCWRPSWSSVRRQRRSATEHRKGNETWLTPLSRHRSSSPGPTTTWTTRSWVGALHRRRPRGAARTQARRAHARAAVGDRSTAPSERSCRPIRSPPRCCAGAPTCG